MDNKVVTPKNFRLRIGLGAALACYTLLYDRYKNILYAIKDSPVWNKHYQKLLDELEHEEKKEGME